VLSFRKNRNYISATKYRSLLLSDGVLPRAYGLPKIHKDNCPLRVIVSSINSPLHSFALFLHQVIFSNIPKAHSHITNSYDLVDKLKSLHVCDHYHLASLDVVSLFTNVPTELAIGSIGKRWHFIENKISIPYGEFLIGVRLVVNSTFFQFNNKIYQQIFGTPMGSPLSPILADLVLQDLEEKAITRLPIPLPLYFRYVDDIVLAAPPSFFPTILTTFNSFHKRLQFTIEKSINNRINFLDISICLTSGNFIIDWYRKPTFSGRFLNFFSQHPVCQKRGVIYGLVDRIFRLSHPQFHDKNLALIINILLNNDYPLDFIFMTIRNRIKNLILHKDSSQPSPLTSLPTSSSTSQPSPFFFTVPYIKDFTEKLLPIFKKANASVAYVGCNKLNKIIKTQKDPLPFENHSNVVYKINCRDCDASYVGQTGRRLITRIKEHRSNINRVSSSHSVITEHHLTGHDFTWNNVQILDEEPSYIKRHISEMLHIKQQKNGINLQDDTRLLDNSYLPIIKKCS